MENVYLVIMINLIPYVIKKVQEMIDVILKYPWVVLQLLEQIYPM